MTTENKIEIFNNKENLLKVAKTTSSKALLLNEIEILKKIDFNKIIKINNEDLEFSVLLANGLPVNFLNNPWDIIKDIILKLKKIHSYGICYFNLRTDNILLINNEINLVSYIYANDENIIPQYNSLKEVKYASPEILSRTTSKISYLSDYYSLGVVMYEIFTGTLPFDGNTIEEIIYKQTTEIPSKHEKLSKNQWSIISKLLEKNSDNRYKTLDGLLYDIEKCKNEIPFIPGAIDKSSYFNIKKKIYGRAEELQELKNNYSNKIITIGGSSGSGKSALVNEFIKQINFPIDNFIIGKFEQYEKNKPLSAIITLFNNIVINILKSDKASINKWKNIFIKKLSINIKIISDLIPSFEKIVGEVPPLQELSPNENLNRFYNTIVNFVKILDEENELIFFIDDIQWADSSSFLLLDNLFKIEFKNLKFILVYRDNEINELHPFSQLKEKYNNKIFNLNLLNLKKESISDLISDLLYLTKEELNNFNDLLYKKTNGNIFYVIKVLQQLYQNKNIYFDYDLKKWIINFDINELSYHDDVIALLLSKISTIEDTYKKILQYASVIGSGFTFNFISKIIDINELYLKQAVNDDFLYYKNKKYYFTHDKIEESFYKSIDSENIIKIKVEIGENLLNESSNNIFDILNNLNPAINILNKDKLNILLDYNLKGIKLAQENTAYSLGYYYIKSAQDILNKLYQNPKDENYSIFYKLNFLEIENNYLLNKFEYSEKKALELLNILEDNLDKSEICNQLIIQYCSTGRYSDAFEYINKALDFLNEDKFDEDIQTFLNKESDRIEKTLNNNSIEILLKSKPLTDRSKIILIKILVNSLPMAYNFKPALFPLISARGVNIFLNYGTSGDSYCVSCYSIYLAALGKYHEAYLYSKIALELSIQYNNTAEMAKASNVFANYTTPWIKPLIETEELNYKGIQYALDSGEFLHGGYSMMNIGLNSFYSGKDLLDTKKRLEELINYSNNMKNVLCSDTLFGVKLILSNFIEVDSITEKEYSEQCQANGSIFSLCLYKIMKLVVLYLKQDFKNALELLSEIEQFLPYIQGQHSEIQFIFYKSLIQYECIDSLNKEEVLEYIKSSLSKLENLSNFCYENYKHKADILKAIIISFENKKESISILNDALFESRKNNFLHEAAIASNYLAKFWSNVSKEMEDHYSSISQIFLWNWGIRKIFNSNLNLNSKKDIQTLFKSLEMIKEDYNVGSLIRNILKLLQEYSGSLISCFILKEDSKYYIWEGKEKKFFTEETIPLTILNFIENSETELILNDAINSNFGNDMYIKNKNIKSLFVLPIYIDNKLKGILYLENNLISNLYSIEKIDIIQIIITHGKNSILNILNKNNFEKIIIEKTKEIEDKNKKLEESIEYGKRIQASLLPKKLPENSFVIWKPKDIVSGDFYWTLNEDNTDYIVIADCTGHGVSGALISIIGINLLHKIIKQDKITSPEKILFALNNEFINLVNPNEEHTDGMEIGLLKITKDEILFSGAKRELLIIDNEMSIIKGDKYEVGGKILNKNFTLYSISKKEMKLYMYSDGLSSLEIADQLLQNIGVRNLLQETSASTIENQENFLNNFIITNLNNKEQRDDYLIFGLKI
jgi:predicted ATPase/serine phosphatase RsbU (regulator of sigma subunit)